MTLFPTATRSAPQCPMSAVYCHHPSLYVSSTCHFGPGCPLRVWLPLIAIASCGDCHCHHCCPASAATLTFVKEGETEAATVTADTLKPARSFWELATLAPLLAAVN